MFILSLLIDVYAFFDVSLRRQASMTQAEKFLDLFASRAMLICSIIWLESGCCGLLFLVVCSSLMSGPFCIAVVDRIVWKLFLR